MAWYCCPEEDCREEASELPCKSVVRRSFFISKAGQKVKTASMFDKTATVFDKIASVFDKIATL